MSLKIKRTLELCYLKHNSSKIILTYFFLIVSFKCKIIVTKLNYTFVDDTILLANVKNFVCNCTRTWKIVKQSMDVIKLFSGNVIDPKLAVISINFIVIINSFA